MGNCSYHCAIVSIKTQKCFLSTGMDGELICI